jgi:hypothetical protein
MKTYFFTIVLGFALSQIVFAQTQQQQIAEIDRARQEINCNAGNLYSIEDLQDSTGCLYVYSDNKELKLETVYVENNNMDKYVEWYFLNGQMIYASQLWIDRTTNKSIVNEKLYLSEGRLIGWIKNDNQTIDNTSKEFQERNTLIVKVGEHLESDFAERVSRGEIK